MSFLAGCAQGHLDIMDADGQEHFTRGLISEQQYGYILAAIEYDYLSKLKHAARQLAENNINKKQYDHLLMQAKLEFNGR